MAHTDFIKNYTTYRITCTNAGTEYSQALSDRPIKISVSADDLTSIVQFSFTENGSGTGKKVFQGAEWTSPGFVVNSKTIYVQSPNAGAVVVVETWMAP